MKFVKQILVGGLLLTALGQSSYAASTVTALEEKVKTTATQLQAMQPAALIAAENQLLDSAVAVEQKVLGFFGSSSISIFSLFTGYMPSAASIAGYVPASLRSPVYTMLTFGTDFVDQANGLAKRIADSLKPAATASTISVASTSR